MPCMLIVHCFMQIIIVARHSDSIFSNTRQRNGARYLILSILVIILDQITKYWCVENIAYNTLGIEVLPFFNLVHVYNYGAAFSMFSDWGGSQRYILSGIALFMALVFILMLLRTKSSAKWHCIAYTLFIGGAIGNLIDRVMHGYVVDFLLFYLKDEYDNITWAYPAFNVADIAVCIGAFLMVLLAFFSKEKQHSLPLSLHQAQKLTFHPPSAAILSALALPAHPSTPLRPQETSHLLEIQNYLNLQFHRFAMKCMDRMA